MIAVQRITALFDNHRPTLVTDPSLKRAEVALVLNPATDREDPKSSFSFSAPSIRMIPGRAKWRFQAGAASPEDALDGAAARRETFEEIGLALSASQLVGRLDDMRGRHGGRSADLVISCFVFIAESVSALRPNHEVSDVVSLPISRLLDPSLRTTVRYDAAGGLEFPGVFSIRTIRG